MQKTLLPAIDYRLRNQLLRLGYAILRFLHNAVIKKLFTRLEIIAIYRCESSVAVEMCYVLKFLKILKTLIQLLIKIEFFV